MVLSACRTSVLLAAALVLASCNRDAPAPSGAAAPAGDAAGPVAAAPGTTVALAVSTGPAPAAGGNCALDFINGAPGPSTSLAAGAEANMIGWVASPEKTIPADAMLLLSGAAGSYSGALPAGGDRPDVAAALGSPDARMSGFNVQVSLAGVAPGDYALSIVQGSAAPVACPLNKNLVVTARG